MNKQDIAEVKGIIEDIMQDYIFATFDDSTIKNITNDIAANIGVNEMYDYVLDVVPYVDDCNIKVELAIKNHESNKFTYIDAQFIRDGVDIPNLAKSIDNNKAYEHAMEIIDG